MRVFFVVAITVFSSAVMSVFDVGDNFCRDNGGEIHVLDLHDKAVSICRFIEGEIRGHDGAYFILSECEKMDFFEGRCKKRECAKIEVSIREGLLEKNCLRRKNLND